MYRELALYVLTFATAFAVAMYLPMPVLVAGLYGIPAAIAAVGAVALLRRCGRAREHGCGIREERQRSEESQAQHNNVPRQQDRPIGPISWMQSREILANRSHEKDL